VAEAEDDEVEGVVDEAVLASKGAVKNNVKVRCPI
jgi:hypothetical protein